MVVDASPVAMTTSSSQALISNGAAAAAMTGNWRSSPNGGGSVSGRISRNRGISMDSNEEHESSGAGGRGAAMKMSNNDGRSSAMGKSGGSRKRTISSVLSQPSQYGGDQNEHNDYLDYYEYLMTCPRDKVQIPSNAREIVESIPTDKEFKRDKNKTLTWDEHIRASTQVSLCILLGKHIAIQKQKRADANALKRPKVESDTSSSNDLSYDDDAASVDIKPKTGENGSGSGGGSNKNDSTSKLNRIKSIPEWFFGMTQKGAKLGMCAYVMNEDKVRSMLLVAIYNDKSVRNVAQVVELCKKTTGDIKLFAKEMPSEIVNLEERKAVMMALMFSADICKSSQQSKIAFDMDRQMFHAILRSALAKGDGSPFKNKEVVEPLFILYCKSYVPPELLSSKRKPLIKNLKNSRKLVRACLTMYEEIDIIDKKAAENTETSQLDPNMVYYYFVGTKNFHRDMSSSYRKVDNVRYIILLCSDLLYDVSGCRVFDANGESRPESFDELTWEERLNKLPKTPRIQLRKATGKYIMDNIPGGTDIVVAWNDENGLFKQNYVHIKKRATKRSSSEMSASKKLKFIEEKDRALASQSYEEQ